jgi:hypothetical protein
MSSAYVYIHICTKAPESKRQYPRRLKIFLDYLRLEGNLEEHAEQFYSKAIENPRWAEDALMNFISYQKERSKKGELSGFNNPELLLCN